MSWIKKFTQSFNSSPKNTNLRAVDIIEKSLNSRTAVARRKRDPKMRERLNRLGFIKDDYKIIAESEAILASAKDPIDRHFAFIYLEKSLYRLREQPGMLEQFELTCVKHDEEIGNMLPSLRNHDETLPVISMYKQMAIYKEKVGDFKNAIMWSENGLRILNGDCVKEDYETDLKKRIKRLIAKSQGQS